MAASTTTCEAIWLRKLLLSFFRKRMEATRVYCDNQSFIKLFENPVFHDRSKHIDIRCHFIRHCVQHGAVQLQCVLTGDQVTGVVTKALGRATFIQFREQMGMVENPFQQQKQVISQIQWQGMRENCNTGAVLAVAGSTTIQMQHLHNSWWVVMLDINSAEADVTEQGDPLAGRLLEHIPR